VRSVPRAVATESQRANLIAVREDGTRSLPLSVLDLITADGLNKTQKNLNHLKFVGHFQHLSHIICSLGRLILRTRTESVRIDRQIDRMDIAELKAELEMLHGASFGWP